MSNNIKETFNKIHAEEELKIKTKSYIYQKTNGYKKRSSFKYHALPVIACLFLFILSAGGLKLYFTPTSIISIDINPSVELGINMFDKIISVKGYNDDGNDLADLVDIKYSNYKYGLEQLINSQTVTQCLSNNGSLSITVAGSNQKQCNDILSNAQDCTSGHQNTYCHMADYNQIESAHQCGLSVGKYMAYIELQALDSSIKPEDVQNMTMREIRDLINSLSSENTNSSNNKNNQNYQYDYCDENEHGHGNGHHGNH